MTSGTTQQGSYRLYGMTEGLLQGHEEGLDRRKVGREDPVRTAFTFLSITMVSLFMAMAVVQVVIGQPQRTDRTMQQLEELEHLVKHRSGPIF